MNDKIIEKLKCKRNLKHIGKDNQNRSLENLRLLSRRF